MWPPYFISLANSLPHCSRSSYCPQNPSSQQMDPSIQPQIETSPGSSLNFLKTNPHSSACLDLYFHSLPCIQGSSFHEHSWSHSISSKFAHCWHLPSTCEPMEAAQHLLKKAKNPLTLRSTIALPYLSLLPSHPAFMSTASVFTIFISSLCTYPFLMAVLYDNALKPMSSWVISCYVGSICEYSSIFIIFEFLVAYNC